MFSHNKSPQRCRYRDMGFSTDLGNEEDKGIEGAFSALAEIATIVRAIFCDIILNLVLKGIDYLCVSHARI